MPERELKRIKSPAIENRQNKLTHASTYAVYTNMVSCLFLFDGYYMYITYRIIPTHSTQLS